MMENMSKLTVVTQNCYGLPFTGYHRRFREIAEALQKLKPDIVFLQEIVMPDGVWSFNLSDYRTFYQPGILVKGGLVTLVRKSLNPEHVLWQRFRHQGKIISQQVTDRMLGKGFLVTRIAGDILLVNTHLVSLYGRFTPLDPGQAEQLGQLQAYLKNQSRYILAGDLNFPEGGPYYQKLVPMMKDVTGGMGITNKEESAKFDYIFTSGLEHTLERNWFVHYPEIVSDHKGIAVTLNETSF